MRPRSTRNSRKPTRARPISPASSICFANTRSALDPAVAFTDLALLLSLRLGVLRRHQLDDFRGGVRGFLARQIFGFADVTFADRLERGAQPIDAFARAGRRPLRVT